jgi:hypothetical protein
VAVIFPFQPMVGEFMKEGLHGPLRNTKEKTFPCYLDCQTFSLENPGIQMTGTGSSIAIRQVLTLRALIVANPTAVDAGSDSDM